MKHHPVFYPSRLKVWGWLGPNLASRCFSNCQKNGSASPAEPSFTVLHKTRYQQKKKDLEVSWNRGTPKSSMFIRFSMKKSIHFWGTPNLGNSHIKSTLAMTIWAQRLKSPLASNMKANPFTETKDISFSSSFSFEPKWPKWWPTCWQNHGIKSDEVLFKTPPFPMWPLKNVSLCASVVISLQLGSLFEDLWYPQIGSENRLWTCWDTMTLTPTPDHH